jgi:hypothetical protein
VLRPEEGDSGTALQKIYLPDETPESVGSGRTPCRPNPSIPTKVTIVGQGVTCFKVIGGTDDHRNASIRRRPATRKLPSNSTAEHTSHAVCRDRASGDIFIGETAPYRWVAWVCIKHDGDRLARSSRTNQKRWWRRVDRVLWNKTRPPEDTTDPRPGPMREKGRATAMAAKHRPCQIWGAKHLRNAAFHSGVAPRGDAADPRPKLPEALAKAPSAGGLR